MNIIHNPGAASAVDPASARVHIRLVGDDGRPLPGHICLPAGDAGRIAEALRGLTDPLVVVGCTAACEESRRRLAAASREAAGGAL